MNKAGTRLPGRRTAMLSSPKSCPNYLRFVARRRKQLPSHAHLSERLALPVIALLRASETTVDCGASAPSCGINAAAAMSVSPALFPLLMQAPPSPDKAIPLRPILSDLAKARMSPSKADPESPRALRNGLEGRGSLGRWSVSNRPSFKPASQDHHDELRKALAVRLKKAKDNDLAAQHHTELLAAHVPSDAQ